MKRREQASKAAKIFCKFRKKKQRERERGSKSSLAGKNVHFPDVWSWISSHVSFSSDEPLFSFFFFSIAILGGFKKLLLKRNSELATFVYDDMGSISSKLHFLFKSGSPCFSSKNSGKNSLICRQFSTIQGRNLGSLKVFLLSKIWPSL